MKIPLLGKKDKYQELKKSIEDIVNTYREMYHPDDPCYNVTTWLCADLIDAVNKVENEK